MWHFPRAIFDLAIESLKKVKRLKKTQMIAENKVLKWEIDMKDTLKTSCIWKLDVHFEMMDVSKKS